MLPRPLHRHTPLLHLAREPSRGCSEVVGSAAGKASNGRNRDGDVVVDDNEEALEESGSESPFLLEWSDEEEGAAVPRKVNIGRTAADALDTMEAATGGAVTEDAASGQEYATLKHVEAGGEAGASTKPWPAAAQAAPVDWWAGLLSQLRISTLISSCAGRRDAVTSSTTSPALCTTPVLPIARCRLSLHFARRPCRGSRRPGSFRRRTCLCRPDRESLPDWLWFSAARTSRGTWPFERRLRCVRHWMPGRREPRTSSQNGGLS